MDVEIRQWHHGPAHVFAGNTNYIVTAGTLDKRPIFKGDERLAILQNLLFEVASAYKWELQAWALFANHYHFIAKSPPDGKSLKNLIQPLHSQSAREVNNLDLTPGRRVWFQYWDTCLTYEKSYLARLNYVHNNPVKHGLASIAEEYSFCSAAWFNGNADPQFRQKVEASPYDCIKIEDDY